MSNIIREYSNKEIETMNFILGKDKCNVTFTKFELEAMNLIDLSDDTVVNICKVITVIHQ